MPQVFQVLRCYKCLVFQVHQTKKSNKFACKMCGEKQSIKRHYGLGNGQECRKHVQKLNGIRGEIENSKSSQSISTDDENEDVSNAMPITIQTLQNKPSKWSEYVEKCVEKTEPPNSDDAKNMYLNDTEVVLELPKKRKISKSFNRNRNESTKTRSDSVQTLDEKYASASLENYSLLGSGSTQNSNILKNSMFKPPLKKEVNQPLDFEILTPSLKSADLDYELSNDRFDTDQKETSHSQSNDYNRKKIVITEINKNSKWAKFAEDSVENEDNYLEEPKISENKPNTLFSLCDDVDIDDYLTI